MTPSEIAEISKYMTIWFKKTPMGYSDFREVPTRYALDIFDKIKKDASYDKIIDAEFGKGFSEYLREAMLPIEEIPKQASIDKFG